MIRKLLVLLVILLAFTGGYNLGNQPPPPTPPPPTVLVYGAIIVSQPGDPISIGNAIGTLGYASNIHQWYLDNPWAMNRYTGGEAWHTNWINAYDDINMLIWTLAKEAGRVP